MYSMFPPVELGSISDDLYLSSFRFSLDETLGVAEMKPEDWQALTGDNPNIESRAKPQIIHLYLITYFLPHI